MAFLFLYIIQLSWGADFPNWVNQPPASDVTYSYYVGRSTDEKKLSQAWRSATQDAYETAIRENFGVATSIQASNFESLGSSQLNKRTDEKSQRVRLERFEQVNSFLERRDDGVDLYLLFRYPKLEIEKERLRLASNQDLSDSELTEIGNNSSQATTQVRIESIPSGAEVYINESRWGVTPLVIKGILPVGVYDLSVRHPQFQDINEKLILMTGKAVSVRKILQPASGWIRVEPIPSNAQVTIDGRMIGLGNTDSILVPAGVDVKVEVSHPDCETIIRVIKVSKNEARNVRVELPQLPDHFDKNKENLIESEGKSFWPSSDWYQNSWIIGIPFEMSESSAPNPFDQSIFGVGISFEKRFFYRFGFRTKLMLESALESPRGPNNNSDQSSNNSEDAISGSSFSLGLPIYLSGQSEGFYIMPEVGKIKRKVPSTYYEHSYPQMKQSDRVTDFSYTRSGITLGYQDLEGHYDVWVTQHTYTWDKDVKHSSWLFGISFSFGTR